MKYRPASYVERSLKNIGQPAQVNLYGPFPAAKISFKKTGGMGGTATIAAWL